MSRTLSHQRTHLFYQLQKQVHTSTVGPKKKSPLGANGLKAYDAEYERLIKNEHGFSEHEIKHKIADKHGNKRKAQARLKTVERRIQKRSERKNALHNAFKEINKNEE